MTCELMLDDTNMAVFLFFLRTLYVNPISFYFYFMCLFYLCTYICLCVCVSVCICACLLCYAVLCVRLCILCCGVHFATVVCVCVVLCCVVQCVENHLDHLSKKCLAGASSPRKVVSLPSQAPGLSLVNQPINLSLLYTHSSCLLVRLILVSGRVGYYHHTVTRVNKTR